MPSVTRRDLLGSLTACAVGVHVGEASAGALGRRSNITHGSEIDIRRVGPSARGYQTLQRHPGALIKDNVAYSFARHVPHPATYEGFEVGRPHLLIEGISFIGSLDIYTSLPIVFMGSSVRVEAASHWAIHTRPGAGPFYFLWSDAGALTTAGAPTDKSHAVGLALQLRSDDAVVYRSHISKATDGIHPNGSRHRIIENLIEELTYFTGDHNDGIQIEARGPDITILRNKILNANPQTSCLLLQGDKISVHDNYLAGGGWVIYAGAHKSGSSIPAASNLSIRGNIFGRDFFPKGGHFGPVTYWDGRLGNDWINNKFADGEVVYVR